MATTMKGIIGGGGTTFSASPATVSIPTGSTNFNYRGIFTPPPNVKVVKVRLYGVDNYGNKIDETTFVGVTPSREYRLTGELPYERPDEQEIFYMDAVLYSVVTGTNKLIYWIGVDEYNADNADPLSFTISWSPEINTHTPTVTDY